MMSVSMQPTPGCPKRPDWAGLLSSGRYYPILDCLFSHLSIADYVVLRRVSKACSNLDDYVKPRFWNIDLWLKTFVHDGQHFRDRMRETGAIVAGTCLLDFLTFQQRPRQGGSLDVYVATRAQAESLQSVLLHEQYASYSPKGENNSKPGKHLEWRPIDRQNTEIRLHVTDRSPLLSIFLNASSTTRLNFMTADKVYCMFPWLTFVHKKVLPLRPMGDEVGIALREVETILGWGTENYIWPDQHHDVVARVSGPRRVGDRETLMVSLGQNRRSTTAKHGVENHQFHITKDRFGGRRPSRTRSQQTSLLDLANYTPQILVQELFSPALSDRCLTGTPLWRSFLTDRLRRWAMVEMFKVGRDQMPARLRADVLASAMVEIPDTAVIPESWRFADEQVQDWYDEWCKDESAKTAYRGEHR